LTPHFPQLEILELLGQGGMGAVYKARQPGLDRLVALKILPPEAGRDTAFAERFAREARALAKLNHPHIVTVYDFGKASDFYYFVMEYVDGANLRHLIRSAHLSPAEALRIVPQICEGLQFAHEEGIVHRDIKPENILIDRKGRVKIADFGIAKLLGHNTASYTLTGPWQVMGTLHYMAPEQVDHPLAVDHRADIYSLGVVFYEMLTRQLPLGRFLPPSQKVPVDVRLDNVVLRSLESEPDRRYQHASEIKTDLEAIAAGLPPTEGPAVTALDETLYVDPDYEGIRRKIMLPAVGLLIVGLLWLLPVIGVPFFWMRSDISQSMRWLTAFLGALSTLIGVVIIVGVIKMTRLQWLPLALTCSILAMLPLVPVCFLGFPIGLWAFLVLRRPQVIAAFQRNRLYAGPAEPTRTTPARAPAPTIAAPVNLATPVRPSAPPTVDWVPFPARNTLTPPAQGSGQQIHSAVPTVLPVETPFQRSSEEGILRRARKQILPPMIGTVGLGIMTIIDQMRDYWEKSSSLLGLGTVIGAVLLLSGWKMYRLGARGLALAAAILSMVPGFTPHYLIGLAVGVWLLVTLSVPNVRWAFQINRRRSMEIDQQRPDQPVA